MITIDATSKLQAIFLAVEDSGRVMRSGGVGVGKVEYKDWGAKLGEVASGAVEGI